LKVEVLLEGGDPGVPDQHCPVPLAVLPRCEWGSLTNPRRAGQC
jgi:hypothetical protein